MSPTDLDTLIVSAVSEHYRPEPQRSARALFPNGASFRPVERLIRT